MISNKIIQKFSNQMRFSGNHLDIPESVPDHSVEMALLCINISELVPESDKRDMCYRCVIHDLEEALTSDIPRPIKHRSPEIKRLVDEAAKEMLVEESSELFTEEVFSAKDKGNVNGFIVHIADRLQCYLKMCREVMIYGNKSLEEDLDDFKLVIYELLDEIDRCEVMSLESRKKFKSFTANIISKPFN